MKNKLHLQQLISNFIKWGVESSNCHRTEYVHYSLYIYFVNLSYELGVFSKIPINSANIRVGLNNMEHHVYFKALNDLLELGFIQEVENLNSYDPKYISLEYSENLRVEMNKINNQL